MSKTRKLREEMIAADIVNVDEGRRIELKRGDLSSERSGFGK